MEEAFRFGDELGPFKLVHIHRSSVGLKAVVAIDNNRLRASDRRRAHGA